MRTKLFCLGVILAATLVGSNLQAQGTSRGYTSTQVLLIGGPTSAFIFSQPLPQSKATQKLMQGKKTADKDVTLFTFTPTTSAKTTSVVDNRKIVVTADAVDKRLVVDKPITAEAKLVTAKADTAKTDPHYSDIRKNESGLFMTLPAPKARRHGLGDWP